MSDRAARPTDDQPASHGVPDDRPVLPERAADDRDEGWGERVEDGDPADRRLWEDRPPHHDGRSSW